MSNHDHRFDDVTSVERDGEYLVTRRRCQRRVTKEPSVSPRGGFSPNEEPCDAEKVMRYELRSVTDNHDHHPDFPTNVRLDGEEPTLDNSVSVEEFDETPEWVETAKERALGAADVREPGMFMHGLHGPEISFLIATSETEYNATFTRVDESIEE